MKGLNVTRLISGLMTVITVTVLSGCGGNQRGVNAEEAEAIATEAYVYGFPLVMGYKTMYSYVVDKNNPEYRGSFNELVCFARLFTPDDRAIVTPNADTPYCMAWMDLRAEPMVLSVPEMEPDRFYHFQLIDLYTHNFAYLGTLTTGNRAGTFLIAGPSWDREKPEGVTEVVRSETDFVFSVTRTQLFGPSDLANVQAIQAGYDLQPLSAYYGDEAPAALPLPSFPKWIEGSQFDERFFGYLDFMLTLLGEPLDDDKPLWDRMASLGIGQGLTFDFAAQPPEIQEALKAGVIAGRSEIEEFVQRMGSDPLGSSRVFGTRAFLEKSAKENYGYDNPYLIRAAAAHLGLYGNSAAEALYPFYAADAEGNPLDASAHRYSLTFAEDELPPVKAFWSLTMYDGKTQLFVRNPLNRYLLNSTMMDHFVRQPNGSIVLYISKDSPGERLQPNWLPAPDGPFYMVLRLYGPEPAALRGEWTPPAVNVIN